MSRKRIIIAMVAVLVFLFGLAGLDVASDDVNILSDLLDKLFASLGIEG